MIGARALTIAAAVAAAAGCATAPMAPGGMLLPRAPSEQGKCRVAASQGSPLVTEWPASEKANLEALLRAGAVAVAYSGCSMRLLPQCQVQGAYHWRRTTPSTDVIEINDEDDLYAKLPLGAASLEGELKRSGKLAVHTTVAGQLRLEGAAVASVPADGPCAGATHVVGALSVGAFALSAGGSVQGRASATVASVGETGGGSTRSAGLVRSAGDPDVCGQGTDQAPHPNCASPIQVFLWALPGRAAEEGPPGTVKVDFVSGNPASRWDVYADDQVVCTTPCSRFIHPARPVMLRAREDSFMPPQDKVQVANLMKHAAQPHLQLEAHPTARGKLVTGIAFTSLTGMATLAGITLTSLGCASDDRAGMCKAGLITLGSGATLLAGSIWLIFDAMPHARVAPHGDGTLVLAPKRTIWGPGFVAGTF